MPVKGCRGSEVDDRHLNGGGRLNHQCREGPEGPPGTPLAVFLPELMLTMLFEHVVQILDLAKSYRCFGG